MKEREIVAGEQEEVEDAEGEPAADAEHGELDIGDDEGEDDDDDEGDDEMSNDFEEEGAAAQERRMSHIDASASDSDREGEEDGGAGAGDNKAASFARAFAKIIAGGQTQRGILSVSRSRCLLVHNHMRSTFSDGRPKIERGI